MVFLRSLVFNVAFYANLIVWMIVVLPSLALPRPYFAAIAKAWSRSSIWLMKVIVGTRLEVRGREHLPKGGYVLASKHQSFFETFALFPEMEDGAFILKSELMWIPLFGWYLWKNDMVPVNRGGRSAALADMNAKARAKLAQGRQIVIFPEGTRRQAGAPPAYKQGVGFMYGEMGAPVVPVALNTGLFWPRRRFLRHPGTIVIEFLPVIPAGLPRLEFTRRLQTAIETTSDILFAEGLAQLDETARADVLRRQAEARQAQTRQPQARDVDSSSVK
jgi:1-acyl-sn-glycerol-3-phosphate acyltransferase